MSRLMDMMKVDLPEGTVGDVSIRHFEIGDGHLGNLLEMIQGHGRETRHGTYTALHRGETLWMSDTDAERRDHVEAAMQIERAPDGARVLIGGLGLGCILRVALLTENVAHVDVVEIDPDVIALVGPVYTKLAEENGKTVTFHQADLLAMKWKPGTRWDVAWFDIWPTLCTDDLKEHARLARSYSRRTGWYGCWGHVLLLDTRDRRGGWW